MSQAWETTANSLEYKQALTATATLSTDNKPEGFVQPEGVGQKGITATIKQNNTLLQLLTT